jgi:hypothetical protein
MSVIYLDPLRCYLPHVKREEKNKGNHMLCECEKRKKTSRTGLRSHVVCVLREKRKATELRETLGKSEGAHARMGARGNRKETARVAARVGLLENRKEPARGWDCGACSRRTEAGSGME